MKNKMYMVTVSEYNGYIRTNILDTSITDNFEDSINYGKRVIRDYFYNILYKNITDDELDLIPDDISDEELDLLIKNYLDKDIRYEIIITIMSTNRKRFNTSKELMNYFNNNIENISNENLYDFLLSMIISYDKIYDYRGNLSHYNINEQCPVLEGVWDAEIDFDEESCKKRIYKFNYHIF